MKKNIKLISLIMNVIAIVVTSAILIGSTFAWFTDSATSSGNKIKAGTLKIDLQLLDKEQGWLSIKDDKTPIFDYENWEPGYTDVKILKVENEGSLALQWKARFFAEKELSELANVIDVYVLPSSTELSYPTDRNLEDYSCVGTVADFVNTIESTTKGTLLAKEKAYLGIALKMRTDAGNEYQGLDLGGAFDIMIVATQLSSESDGFNDGYDSNASYNSKFIYTPNQFRLALSNRESELVLMNDIEVNSSINVLDDVVINGNGFNVYRKNVSTFSRSAESSFVDNVFVVKQGAELVLENIVVDGGAIWAGEVDSVLKRGTENEGVTAGGALIAAEANAKIVLGEGAIVQNNCGANAINLGTRIGATLTLDGGKVINNCSNAGAIWGGGHITVNSGEISYNSSTGIAGAIRMVSQCNLTMNGGKINNNKATTDGGAVWGYGASTFIFEGGQMSNNSATVGGAILTGDGSSITISGDFEVCNNVANEAGAFRLSNYTSFIMTGGKLSGNISKNQPKWNGFYGWNPGVIISGGQIDDSIFIQGGLTPTVGGSGINGIVYFDVNTNHNTCNLSSEFGRFAFYVSEDENFNAFNFKPASDYSYKEGDEAKLVCLNEGYQTYWDADTNTFRLQKSN